MNAVTKTQRALLEKIRRRGQINHRKLLTMELIDAIELNELGLIKFKQTRKGNSSKRFIVIKEGGEG
tara:strand:- start:368 stop:568 length:201 start_codon:yes stop_codon:yes gene_type:complete